MPGLTSHRETLLTYAAGLLALAGLAGYLAWLIDAGPGTPAMGWDFRAYYAAAGAIRNGANLYELAGPAVPFYLYPPTLAALLIPLSFLSLAQATLAWLVLQHLFLAAGGYLVVRIAALAAPGQLPRAAGAFLGGLLIFLWGTGMPLRQEIYLGQVNSLVLLLSAAGLYLGLSASAGGRQLRSAGAGLLMALAISIKVFPALLLLLLLLRGRGRAAAWTAVLFLGLQVVVGLLTVGPTGYSSTLDYWFSLFPDLPGRPQPYIENQSINGWLARLLLPAAGAPLEPGFTTWRLLTLALSASIGLLGALVLRYSTSGGRILSASLKPPSGSARNWPLEAALLLTTINIVSSISWTHHMLWWVLPALALVVRWGAAPWRASLLGYACLLLVALLLSVSAPAWLELGVSVPFVPAALAGGFHLFAMLLLWALLARELLRGGPARSSGSRLN